MGGALAFLVTGFLGIVTYETVMMARKGKNSQFLVKRIHTSFPWKFNGSAPAVGNGVPAGPLVGAGGPDKHVGPPATIQGGATNTATATSPAIAKLAGTTVLVPGPNAMGVQVAVGYLTIAADGSGQLIAGDECEVRVNDSLFDRGRSDWPLQEWMKGDGTWRWYAQIPAFSKSDFIVCTRKGGALTVAIETRHPVDSSSDAPPIAPAERGTVSDTSDVQVHIVAVQTSNQPVNRTEAAPAPTVTPPAAIQNITGVSLQELQSVTGATFVPAPSVPIVSNQPLPELITYFMSLPDVNPALSYADYAAMGKVVYRVGWSDRAKVADSAQQKKLADLGA